MRINEPIKLELPNKEFDIIVHSTSLIANNHYNYRNVEIDYFILDFTLMYDINNVNTTLKRIFEIIHRYFNKYLTDNDMEYILYEYSSIISIYAALYQYNLYDIDEDDDPYYKHEIIYNEITELSKLMYKDILLFNNIDISAYTHIEDDVEDDISVVLNEFFTNTIDNFHDNNNIFNIMDIFKNLDIDEFNAVNIIPMKINKTDDGNVKPTIIMLYKKERGHTII